MTIHREPHIDSHRSARTNEMDQHSVLDLILNRVRLHTRRRLAWLRYLWKDSEPETTSYSVEMAIDDRDNPEAEAAWYTRASEVQVWNKQLEQLEHVLENDPGLKLQQLRERFRLNKAEVDLLQTCLALMLDPTLGSAYGYLQSHKRPNTVTEYLVARLFGHGRCLPCHAGMPAYVWRLVSATEAVSGEPTSIICDPQLYHWLQGTLSIDPQLVGIVQEVRRHEPLPSWPVDETVQFIRRALETNMGIRISLIGPSGSGRRTCAAAFATRLGIPTLAVDTSRISDADWPDVYVRVQRLAVFASAALVWYGAGLGRPWPNQVAPVPLQFLACDDDQLVPSSELLIDHRVKMPMLALEERQAAWVRYIPESASWTPHEFQTLATQHHLTIGDIMTVCRKGPINGQHATTLCRKLTQQRLGDLGQQLNCPFSWTDLVIPEKLRDGLEDFAFEAKEHNKFWEQPRMQRLFPRGTSLVALFTGPPGTGKTMAAQIMAADLDLDLFRIDLATVVSKYIGETAKNLKQIFARAMRMNSILLFDEADALFSKRTEIKDSHDRYANADTNYLLQLLEDYRGIAILATNKKSNIDPAFTRRIRYVFDFPRPDVKQRLRIWQQIIGELSGEEVFLRMEKGIETLAKNVEISGAQIKTSILTSIFIAKRNNRTLNIDHIVRSLERELSKEGRSLGKQQKGRVTGHVS